MDKLSFSGHESFICKQFWLKKVFDYATDGKSFNDEFAVVRLGVGKNMVTSLRFWGRAFGVLDEADAPTEIALYLFGETGKDTYLEDLATVWLLHYQLVRTNRFSVSSLVFNALRKERIEFTHEHLVYFLLRKTKEYGANTDNPKTIERDANVFLRMYSKPRREESLEIEDDFAGILNDLDIVKRYKQRGLDGKLVDWYKIEAGEPFDLPFQIVLFVILDNYEGQKSITFRELLTGVNSPGSVFALSAEGLFAKLKQITDYYKEAVYTETAGNQVLQFKKLPSKFDILNEYYNH
ncbi:DUF4007 family protein [Rhabdobacter roseus]|uniref:DUF4007 domain-containing protein n=1 Tax=Rhabdobacter roseus TaxID=1655419 RepID=A0A840TMH0_9BACT|nr:DUF4007 family protein [Rhabdobacter roseus]MBB5282957.1 hypothetical protein [Rhabdobacter roseus]